MGKTLTTIALIGALAIGGCSNLHSNSYSSPEKILYESKVDGITWKEEGENWMRYEVNPPIKSKILVKPEGEFNYEKEEKKIKIRQTNDLLEILGYIINIVIPPFK